MPRCQVKRGFFLLSDCDQPAFNRCPDCGRSTCREHTENASSETVLDETMRSAEEETKALCLDCLAKHQVGSDPALETTGSAWIHRFRSGFYRQSRYGPIYFGAFSATDSYYDEFDVRSFSGGPNSDSGEGSDPDLASAPDGGFDS
ncbi:MAG: hypothetical protein WA705_11515 [Candidatus Ozemobacteraceae bacterium]